ncbi:MAG TPA: prephenate dehydrogenase/arogenate dehydrogenase family protein [Acidimicrobiales bacterium]|nr:prephenate dehydrogenase/arogenate dehydrogenase family protein [Acidimicrobiales bacterium]
MTEQRRATIIGTGLIGGSVGLALRARGWRVSGVDNAPGLADRAIELGACDAVGIDADSDLVVVATPVGAVIEEARGALAACPKAVVTDVGGVKAAIVAALDDPRFVGGHPMAGSEELGLEGADADLFEGAAWTLCPGPATTDATYATVRHVVASFDAQVLTLSPADHDRVVAVVSHVPHLTAAALVRVTGDHSSDHAALLRLAAGGFRDMTRIASGSPAIWPGVCEQNRDAIVEVLDQLRDELATIRSIVAERDRPELLRVLGEAQQVRQTLPTRPSDAGPHSEIRVFVKDQPGALRAVATLATDLDVNLAFATTIDLDGTAGGMVVLRVLSDDAERLCRGLLDAGFRAFVQNEDET